MYEKQTEPVASKSTFLQRLAWNACVGILVIIVALLIGVLGYHLLEDMPFLEAFLNAALTLSDMGLVTPLKTTGGKIFASIYALFAGLAFISIMGVIFAPIIHRFLHQFYSKDGDKS